MASPLPVVAMTHSAAEPPMPASAAVVAGDSLQHSSASELRKMLRVGWVGAHPPVPLPIAVLTAQRPWVKDKADLTVVNAVLNVAGGAKPMIFLMPMEGNDVGSIQVLARNTSAGKIFVFEFVGASTHGVDFRVSNGPTVHRVTGAFKLPIAITSAGDVATVRIFAENYGGSSTSQAVTIHSIKVWAVT